MMGLKKMSKITCHRVKHTELFLPERIPPEIKSDSFRLEIWLEHYYEMSGFVDDCNFPPEKKS